MVLRDQPHGYGWLSIAFHWIAAIVVIAMLFIGLSIPTENGRSVLLLHTSVGVTFFVLLWVRIIWRLVFGEPKFDEHRRRVSGYVAKIVHYGLLGGIGVMLLTGPIVAWSSGAPVEVFGWFAIPSPFPASTDVYLSVRAAHTWTAVGLGVGITMHIAGVLVHVIVHRDRVFDRIMVAAQPPQT